MACCAGSSWLVGLASFAFPYQVVSPSLSGQRKICSVGHYDLKYFRSPSYHTDIDTPSLSIQGRIDLI
jgi:hypothetical protein